MHLTRRAGVGARTHPDKGRRRRSYAAGAGRHPGGAAHPRRETFRKGDARGPPRDGRRSGARKSAGPKAGYLGRRACPSACGGPRAQARSMLRRRPAAAVLAAAPCAPLSARTSYALRAVAGAGSAAARPDTARRCRRAMPGQRACALARSIARALVSQERRGGGSSCGRSVCRSGRWGGGCGPARFGFARVRGVVTVGLGSRRDRARVSRTSLSVGQTCLERVGSGKSYVAST